MAAFYQQSGSGLDHQTKPINQVHISSLEKQLANLTSAVYQWAAGRVQNGHEVCSNVSYSTDMCWFPQNESYDQRYRSSDYFGQPQMQYDPHSSMHNNQSMDHTDFDYEYAQETQYQPSFEYYQQSYPPTQEQDHASNSSLSLEDIVNLISANTLQFQ